MTDSSTRYSLLELDLPGVTERPVAASVVAVVPAPAIEVGVCQEGKARALVDQAAAEAAGWSLAPPVYAIGSRVNSTGVANFQASRQDHDEKATVNEACANLIDLVAKEERRDDLVKVPHLVMLPNGELTHAGSDPFPLSLRAMNGVGTHITPGGAGYLRSCPSELRAINFNHWATNGYREDSRAMNRAIAAGEGDAVILTEKEATLRTRLNHSDGRREAWGVVGPRYHAHDVDAIAAQVMASEAIPADAKCDITYDGYRMRLDVLFHTNIQPAKAVAGEIFKAGILIKTADDGSGAIQISAQVFRNLCLNLIIIDHAKDMVTRRRHMGQGIANDVANGIATAMGKVQFFADKWSEATVENVLEKYGTSNIEDVMRGLVFNKVVHVSGVKPEEMFDRLMRAYHVEAGYGKTAIINAITRAAHSNPWGTWTDVEDLERKAGELLFTKTAWNVSVSDEEREALSY